MSAESDMSESADLARRVLSLIDLTSLNDSRDDDIGALCEKALTRHGPVAAVCSWPEFTGEMARHLAGAPPKIAAVVNFPHGSPEMQPAVQEARHAADAGAGEIDLVWPYESWIAGDRGRAVALVSAVREVLPEVRLKVILETGALDTVDVIAQAARSVIGAGADMLKTSTGKIAVGATPEAAEAMLVAIRESGHDVGFKASGGIRRLEDARTYLSLAERLMGPGWATPSRFRIGASGLLDGVLSAIDEEDGRGEHQI